MEAKVNSEMAYFRTAFQLTKPALLRYKKNTKPWNVCQENPAFGRMHLLNQICMVLVLWCSSSLLLKDTEFILQEIFKYLADEVVKSSICDGRAVMGTSSPTQFIQDN